MLALVAGCLVRPAMALQLVEADWIDEDAASFSGERPGTGTWRYGSGQAVVAGAEIEISARAQKGEFVTFDDAVESSGNKVEVESEISFGGGSRNLPLLPADAQCSLAYLREGLKVYSAEGWAAVTCAVDLSDAEVLHRLLISVDYTAGTFSMKIDGVPVIAAAGRRVFRLAGRPSKATGVGFSGAVSLRTLKGGCRTSTPSTVTAAEVKAAFADLPPHPRLNVCGPAGLAALRDDPSPEMKALRKSIVAGATTWLSKPCSTLGKNGKRLTGDDDATEAILVSAAAYALSGDLRYAERAKREMLSVCSGPDWVPTHYLGVAELLRGLAFGYDWTYETLTPAERATIRQAIIGRGFGGRSGWNGWDSNTTNWSQVCWQGVLAAALAIYEDDAAEAEALVKQAIPALAKSIAPFAPNGAYPEGPGYWSYGTGRLCLLLDQLEHALGTTFGLYELPGLANTGEYPLAMTGPSGKRFNYSDCSDAGDSYSLPLLYLAARADRPDWVNREYAAIASLANGASSMGGLAALDTLLYARFPHEDAENRIPLDYYGEGPNPVAVLRESFTSHGLFLGIKGGKAKTNHGHMDVGSFVLDFDGQRWATDLGSQDYTALEATPGMTLWNMDQNSTRWDVYRLGADSHNLVTIDGARLKVDGQAEITCVRSGGDVSEAKLDMLPIYGSDIVSAAGRTFTLDRANRKILIGDAFEGLRTGASVRWAMVTKATVTGIQGDEIDLALGGCRMKITMSSTAPGGEWTAVDVSTGPNSWDARNPGCTQIRYTVAAPSSGALSLEAQLVPATVNWPAGTVFYGIDSGKSANGDDVSKGAAQAAIGWWTGPDPSTATQTDVPSPWIGAGCGYEYVLLSSEKITGSSTFPDVPVSIGTSDTSVNLRFNGGIRFLVPDATVYGASFSLNSDKLTVFDGTYRFVKTDNGIKFAGSSVENAPRGASFIGKFVADDDVTIKLGMSFVKGCASPGGHRFAGDFTRFKGSFVTEKPTYGAQHDPFVQYPLIELVSPSALGDTTSPRADALVLTGNARLFVDEAVVQDGSRGITLSMEAGERVYLRSGEEADCVLAAPVVGAEGAVIAEGPDKVTLAGPLAVPSLVVTNGTLAIAPTASLALPKLTAYADEPRGEDEPLLTTSGGGFTLTNEVRFAMFGTNADYRCLFRAGAGTTNAFVGPVSAGSVAGTVNRRGYMYSDAGALTVFGRKFTTDSAPMTFAGPGTVRFAEKYESWSHLTLSEGELIFDRPQNIAYGFNLDGGRVVAMTDNAFKVSSEKAGRTIALNNEMEIGGTTQRLWGLTGSGTVTGSAGSVAAPAGVTDGEIVSCGVIFDGAAALAPASGNWRFTGASTSTGDLLVTNGLSCFLRNGGWAGTNAVVSGTGVLELANPNALSAAYGRLSVTSGGKVSISDGVAARVAAFSVGGGARAPGVYGSAAASARYAGVTREEALDGEGVLVVTGGNAEAPVPYWVTGVLDVNGSARYASLLTDRFSRISVTGGTLGLDLAAETVIRVTTLDLRAGANLDLPAGVTVEAASVFVDGVPLAQGMYPGGDGVVLGEGVLKVLIVSAEHDRRTARVLESYRQLGRGRRWLASWLSPWSVTGFAVATPSGYAPADPDTIDLETTSTAYRMGHVQPMMYFIDFNAVAGTWNGTASYARKRAALTALVKAAYKRWHAIPVFSWHPENPYIWTGYTDPQYGSAAYRCRATSEGYPAQHKYVMNEILENTGETCGFGRSASAAKEDGTLSGYANPRAWFDARLDEIASFVAGLRDDEGRPIPIVSRLYHECEDSWQWWGASFVTKEDYRRIFRYTVEGLRWRLGTESGRILFAYSPDRYCWPRDSKTKKYLADGAETARAEFLSRYAGDDVTDIIGYDDYSIGDGATEAEKEENLVATIRQMALISQIGEERGKPAGLFETSQGDSTDSFFPWLHRAMCGEGCRFFFANTWKLPPADTECEATWLNGYLDQPEVITVGDGYDPLFSGFSVILK